MTTYWHPHQRPHTSGPWSSSVGWYPRIIISSINKCQKQDEANSKPTLAIGCVACGWHSQSVKAGASLEQVRKRPETASFPPSMSLICIRKAIRGFPHHAVAKNGPGTIVCVTMAYRNRTAPLTCRPRLVILTFDYREDVLHLLSFYCPSPSFFLAIINPSIVPIKNIKLTH
jgi:hypothetical protein